LVDGTNLCPRTRAGTWPKVESWLRIPLRGHADAAPVERVAAATAVEGRLGRLGGYGIRPETSGSNAV